MSRKPPIVVFLCWSDRFRECSWKSGNSSARDPPPLPSSCCPVSQLSTDLFCYSPALPGRDLCHFEVSRGLTGFFRENLSPNIHLWGNLRLTRQKYWNLSARNLPLAEQYGRVSCWTALLRALPGWLLIVNALAYAPARSWRTFWPSSTLGSFEETRELVG